MSGRGAELSGAVDFDQFAWQAGVVGLASRADGGSPFMKGFPKCGWPGSV